MILQLHLKIFKSIGEVRMILFTLDCYRMIVSFLQLIKLHLELFSEPTQCILHLIDSDLILHLPLDPGKHLTPHGFYVDLEPLTTRL